jgi:hypothetical protein
MGIGSSIAGIVGPAANLAGGIIGGIQNSNDIQQGMKQYQDYTGKGTAALQGGLASANAAYSPYTATGAAGTSGELDRIQNRQQADQPGLSNVNPSQAMSYLDPSAAYSTDQSNKTIQAQALASGGAGGGMMKALSNNANDRAMTNYNNAYSQMLNTANTNFGQQQQQYANKTGFDQSQIQNYTGLAGQGLQAVGGNQSIDAGYNNGINQNWGDIAANQQSGYNALGKNAKDTWSGAGADVANGIGSVANGISSLWGG